MKIKEFLIKNKAWVFITAVFLSVRILIFSTFWQASLDKGGWQNFYNQAQAAASVLLGIFHDYCDWHPPLYYFLTSIITRVFGTLWAIYIAQILSAGLVLFIAYKIAKLFFSERVSKIAVFILAIEPFWAWHNFLLVSENLSTPLLLAGFYYFFRFTKSNAGRNLYWAAIYWGLATLTRPNTLFLTAVLSLLLIFTRFFKNRLKLPIFAGSGLKRMIFDLIVFNIIFLAVLTPWLVRNKIVYGRFSVSNVLYTNVYLYNLPPLFALKEGISYSDALTQLRAQAFQALGNNVDNQGDCQQFSKAQLNQQFNFFESQAKKDILANLPLYTEMHLIKATPFFFQPGYFEMWTAYTGEFNKPDLTSLILRKNFSGIKTFLSEINLKLIVYLAGIGFWGLCSLAILLACIYSYFREREKFFFFALTFIVVVYNALLISPFVLARYRLPIYILFFIPLAYLIDIIIKKLTKNEAE